MSRAGESGRPGRAAYAACLLAAFAWGLAEAVFLFVVVDVLLTFLALRLGFRRALLAALAAVAGAVAGGLVMRGLAIANPAAALRVLGGVPFLSPATIQAGSAGMANADWPLAMLKGSFTGIPYKVFAVGAGEHGIPALAFAIAGVPIRLFRFVLAVAAVAWIDRRLPGRIGRTVRTVMLAAFWILLYGEFWLRVSGWEGALLP